MSDDPVIPMTRPATASASSAAARRKAPALGRGLGALMGEIRREEALVASPANSDGAESTAGAGGLAMLAIAETVWLQLGPTMRALYARLRRSEPPQTHRMILAALRAGDEPGLRLAVRTDVTQGLRHLAA